MGFRHLLQPRPSIRPFMQFLFVQSGFPLELSLPRFVTSPQLPQVRPTRLRPSGKRFAKFASGAPHAPSPTSDGKPPAIKSEAITSSGSRLKPRLVWLAHSFQRLSCIRIQTTTLKNKPCIFKVRGLFFKNPQWEPKESMHINLLETNRCES